MKKSIFKELIGMVLRTLIMVTISYMFAEMADSALSYSAYRERMLKDAGVIFVCVIIRYFLDKSMLKSKVVLKMPRLVYGMIWYIIATGLSIGILEMYAVGKISILLAVMFLSIIIVALAEKDMYVEFVPNVHDDYEEDEKYEEKVQENGNVDSSRGENNHEYGIANSSRRNDIPEEKFASEQEYSDYESSDDQQTDNLRSTDLIGKKQDISLEDNSYEVDDYSGIRKNSKFKYVMLQLLRGFALLIPVIFCLLIMGNLIAEKYTGIYYSLIFLTGLVSVFTEMICRLFCELYDENAELYEQEMERKEEQGSNPNGQQNSLNNKNENNKISSRSLIPKELEELEKQAIMELRNTDIDEFAEMDRLEKERAKQEKKRRENLLGYGIITLLLTLFLCHRSILIGLVFLLGAFVAAVIIPETLERWGSGGTEVVNQRKVLLSRLVLRTFAIIMILLAVWQLSYGAIWEIDYLIIMVVAISSIAFSE